jgi:serine/threonine protein kinase
MKYFCKKCQSYTERDNKRCCQECGAALKNASIAPSTVIGGFKIVKEIGRGSNGVVYLAEQTSLDRKVALKILPDAKAKDPNFVKDFLKEARAAARLNYSGIIQVYDAGVTNDGIYFLAMELIEGKSLENILQSKGALKPKNAVKIMLKIAKALEYSWNKENLFHGDVKPDNIMIRKDGQPKLADFGLAKTIFDEKSEEIMATPMYAPPEVIRAEHKKIGFKSDMYSFGVTLYEILSGSPPFNEADCEKVLSMHLRKHHIPLTEQMPEVDKSLSDLVDKLLSKNPKQRPASWTEIVKSLQAFQNKKSGSKLKLPLIAGISLAVIICGLAVTAFLYYQKDKKKAPPKFVKKLIIVPKPKVKKTVSPKKEVVTKTVEIKKNDKSHSELEKILVAAKNLNGDILTVSGLKFQALKLKQNKSLSKIEQSKLTLCLIRLNSDIQKKQSNINKYESTNLRLALKKEKITAASKRSKERSINLLLVSRNRIFELITKFLSNRKSQQTIKTLQSLLHKSRNLNKNMPEYKTLTFLLKVLPRKYNREAIIFENLDQLVGKKLPWKIKHQEYIITGGSWQSMHLKTKLSEGVFSRKKIRATHLRNAQWRRLVDEFLIKENLEVTKKNIMNTACWLLLNAKDKLFEDFITKYYPTDSENWLNCRKFVSTASLEVAAYYSWRNIITQMTELNYTAYESINNFKTKYANTEVYKNVQAALRDYQKIVYTIYPKAIADKSRIGSLSMKSNDPTVFSIQNRYRFLRCIPSRTRLSLRTIFNKKLRLLSGNQQFAGQFGIFKNVPCGKVYGWSVPDSKSQKRSLLLYLPALLDVDNWSYIERIFRKASKLKLASPELKEDIEQYPFFLYSTGLVALRYGKWEILDKIFSIYNELIIRDDINSSVCHALFADLALKTRGDQYAWEVLNKYNFKETAQTEEIIIPLLKIQALLTQNPVNELTISELINTVQKHFSAHSALSGDLKALKLLRKFICAGFKQNTDIKANLFSQTAYPHLHARLWLEAAARDKILQRNSIKIPALIKASRSILTSSAFRSDLFKKIISLELGYKNLTPAKLSENLTKSLLELKPYATNSYPSLLTLLFASQLFDHRLPHKQLATFARAYIFRCPSFSPLEVQLCNILNSSNPLNVLNNCQRFSPATFQSLYLWMLAAAKAKRSSNAKVYILKLKSFQKNLRWTEQLLLNRFIQLLENCP